MSEAQRLKNLPAYVFAELDELKAIERAKGADIIDLGMGNPDQPTPQPVVETMIQALKEPANLRYPTFDGLPEFRQAVSRFCHRQYGIEIKDDEVQPLIGSKEGLIHLAFAFVNAGDVTLVPSPAYPAHFNGTILADGVPCIMPTGPENNYLPDFSAINLDILARAKALIISYPTNPTAATAPLSFFEEAVKFAHQHKLLLIHDFAYAEVYFEGKKPPSLLQVPGAKEIGIEYHTFSKSFSMAGWRAGFAVGNKHIINTLRRLKTNCDYGLFAATQKACVTALDLPRKYLDDMRSTYQKRRDLFVDGLKKLGFPVAKPMATMYVWMPVAKGWKSKEWTLKVLEKTGVVLAPGTAFGSLGEGYARVALVDSEARLREALERLQKAGLTYE